MEFDFICILFVTLFRGYLLENTSPNKLQTTLIHNGGDGYIPCLFDNTTTTGVKEAAYSWTYHGHSDINSGRIDFEHGSLHFGSANAQESGLYDCWLSGNNDGQLVTTSFSHKLLVYELPEIEMEVANTYKVPRCISKLDDDTMDNYKEHLCDSMPKPCPYTLEYECVSNGHQTNEEAIQNPKSELTVFVQIQPPSDFIPPPCDAQCVRKALALRMKTLKLRVRSQWHLQFEGDSASLDWYRSMPDTESIKVEEYCPPGFVYYEDVLCAPCLPGFYWSEKTEQCIECPMDTYTEKGASTKCIDCPSKTFTQHVGSTGKEKCRLTQSSKTDEILVQTGVGRKSNSVALWVGLSVGLVLMTALLGFVLFCWCKRRQASGNSDRDTKEHLLDPSEKGKARKPKQKRCASPKCKKSTTL